MRTVEGDSGGKNRLLIAPAGDSHLKRNGKVECCCSALIRAACSVRCVCGVMSEIMRQNFRVCVYVCF
jgi:hypothetical protein